MLEKLLSIQDLTINFISDNSVTTAVQHISFDVHKGEIVAVVGESGSGKSVTALAVLQLLPSPPAQYASGEIIFSNKGKPCDLLTVSKDELQQLRGNAIAMVFQEPMTSLNPVHSCGKQVAEAILTHSDMSKEAAFKKTITLFEDVKLPNPQKMFHKHPHEISGGQKQRVMIAMAMSCNPQLLICDEPTTALDVTVQKNILGLIRNLQQAHEMGVIFISHDLALVSEIADKVVVMYKGQIVEQGTTTAVLASPQHPYTKALLACRPALHQKGQRLPVLSDFINDTARPMTTIVTEKQTGTDDNNRTEKIISVNELSVWYPSKKNLFGKTLDYQKAVNNVSFDIYKGETLGLVGESGCGKTTLGRTLLGLVPPTKGDIRFNGKNMATATRHETIAMRRQMQIIFQDPYSSLNPNKKIGDAIAEPLKVHGIISNAAQRRDKVVELLEKVKLTADHYHRYPHEFSGGQRQRIVIARALALQPSFVVCDESVSALDVSVQAQVLNLLNDLKKDFQFTALFISHDLSVIRYISDRIMVMHKGMIVEAGNSEDVYTHPKTAYTKELIAAIPGKAFGSTL
ncbi:MAG TPA: ABC transporter ATP-binding protein [Panacibacter sp.]|nr:ABC transporter ATP-binding protein [Panacibacter sp.]